MSAEAARARGHYPYWRELQTRWGDNDIYGHMNNVVHYQLFDTVVNRFMAEEAGWDPGVSEAVGLTPETRCRYFRQLRYPDPVEAGLRAAKLGTTSVVYDIGLFRPGEPEAAAVGHFVHVFVRRDRQQETLPVPEAVREAIRRHLAPPGGGAG